MVKHAAAGCTYAGASWPQAYAAAAAAAAMRADQCVTPYPFLTVLALPSLGRSRPVLRGSSRIPVAETGTVRRSADFKLSQSQRMA